MQSIIRPVTVISLSLSLICLLSFGVDARRRGYRPKNMGQFTGATTTTGTRGSCENSKSRLSLTAIAPLSHVGQTTSTNPTLVWFVPGEKSYNMDLLVFQETEGKLRQRVWKTPQPLKSQAGLMQFTLPDEVKLLPDQTYIWQIVLRCNPNRPSQNQIAEAPIKLVVPATSKMPDRKVEASQIGDSQIEDNFWYDLMQGVGGNAVTIETHGLIKDLVAVESEQNSVERVKLQQERLQQVLAVLEPVADQNKR